MVNSNASMLMTQKIPRNNARVFVMTAKGSASIANIIYSPCIAPNMTVTRMHHIANPNTRDLARCVLQQQQDMVTGTRMM